MQCWITGKFKKKKLPNKRRAKLEMVNTNNEKTKHHRHYQGDPHTLCTDLYQNVLNSVPSSSSVQVALKRVSVQCPGEPLTHQRRQGVKPVWHFTELQAIIKMKIKKQWKVFVLNEEEQDGIMGTIPRELLKTRWKHI